MGWRYTPLALPLFLGAALMLAIAAVALRRAPARGGAWMVGLALALCFYDLGYALELGSSGAQAAAFWLKVQYLGVPFESPMLLLLVLAYTGRRPFRSRLSLAAFLALPACVVLAAWTNEWHGLVWRNLRSDSSLGFTRTFFEPGPVYRLHDLYNHVALLWTVVALVSARRAAHGVLRTQLAIMLGGTLVPGAVYLAYLAGGFAPGFDPNPYATLVSLVAVAWGVVQVRMWDLLPIARETVVASQHDAVIVTDLRGRLLDLNPSAQALLGASAQDAVGRPVGAVFPELGRLIDGDRPERAFRTSLELKARHYDVSVAPIEPRAGRVEGRVAVLRDETERRQAENLRDGLVRTLVHDLQNPLTVVAAALELVNAADGERLSQVSRDHIALARANADRLNALAGAILDVHRLKSGRLQLKRESLSLSALCEQAVDLQRPLAQAGGQDLRFVAGAGATRLQGDADLLLRVLQNLIGNALKFTPAGGHVLVSAGRTPGGEVELRVEDDGPGVPAEIEGQLFEEFVSGQQPGRGSGLGLAFCRLAVEAHAGRIAVDRSDRGGAAFRVLLPAEAGEPVAAMASTQG